MAHRKEGDPELEGRLASLKLSEAESSVMKGAWKKKEVGSGGDLQAVGKLFSEKPGNAEGIVNAVGNIWCPRRGIRCRDLGDNMFLFTFLQPTGKRRAIEDGPWEFGGDILIVREFDECCLLEDLEFVYTPMWIRVHRLPIGLMTMETGEEIGDRVGKTIEVDTDEGGSAIGKFLRIKVQFDIRKPLLRGVTMEVGSNGKTQWFPLEHEFLPNFCYFSGLLGHVDRECSKGNWKDKSKPFGPDLRVWPSRRRGIEESRSRSSKSIGSGGAKSVGNSTSPRKPSLLGGRGSDSGKPTIGSAEQGEGSTSPLNSPPNSRLMEGGKNSVEAEATGGCEGEKVDLCEQSGRGLEKEGSQNAAMLGCTSRQEVERVEQKDMEVDEFPLSNPRTQKGKDVSQGESETACAFENGGELLQDPLKKMENKNQRTFKKVRRMDQEFIPKAKSTMERKRSCEDALGTDGSKRQKMEEMWRDENGDVVEVETFSSNGTAGLPMQARPSK